MAYDAISVPECETLRSTTLERLEAFKNAGGKLIFMGDAPKYEDAKPSDRGAKLYAESTCISFNKSSLLEELDEFRSVEIRKNTGELSGKFFHQLRRDTDGMWLFIAHCNMPYNKDVRNTDRIKISVRGEFTPQKWDTQSGNISPMKCAYENGNTVISVELYEYDSLLIFLVDGKGEEEAPAAPVKFPTELKTLPTEVAFELTEPNVLMLDMARFAADDGELKASEEVLRIATALRKELGYPTDNQAQPWVIEEIVAKHTATLEFDVYSDIVFKGAELALEDADKAEIFFNGKKVAYSDLGYYTDVSIRKTKLPTIKKGKNTLRITIPFGERDNIERVYILGNFGVNAIGRKATITKLPETIAFDDITRQGLPFYGGSIIYKLPINCPEDSEYVLRAPHYRAAVLAVRVDGKRVGTIVYPPYALNIGKLTAGKHEVELEAFISRQNCFGHIHCADETLAWIGPQSWKTAESQWTYEYRLTREGIISTPILYKKN